MILTKKIFFSFLIGSLLLKHRQKNYNINEFAWKSSS